jgi:hypothetical protein
MRSMSGNVYGEVTCRFRCKCDSYSQGLPLALALVEATVDPLGLEGIGGRVGSRWALLAYRFELVGIVLQPQV